MARKMKQAFCEVTIHSGEGPLYDGLMELPENKVGDQDLDNLNLVLHGLKNIDMEQWGKVAQVVIKQGSAGESSHNEQTFSAEEISILIGRFRQPEVEDVAAELCPLAEPA